MGGIGMMSAGLIGSAGLGYAKDSFAGEALQKSSPAAYTQYAAQTPSKFLIFGEVHGLDGKKLGEVQKKLSDSREELEKTGTKDPAAALAKLSPDERTVHESSITGDRNTLKADSLIPATMAVIYLIIFIYFKMIGGYKPVHIVPLAEQTETQPPAATTAA
jgi:hypothetical protein